MRFIIEITEAVRAHWPDHKPLFVRLSVEDNAGWGPEQSARLAKILKAKGVDVIDCSSGGISEVAPILGKEIKYGYQVPLSEYVRRHADIMTMAVGLIIHGDQAEQILRDGQADLIAVGREILNNPNWPMDAALKLGVEGAIPQRSAAIRLLAGHPRQARLRNPALDLAKRAAESRIGDESVARMSAICGERPEIARSSGLRLAGLTGP